MTKLLLYKISDSGHGWLEVSRSDLRRSGVADKISAYSYQQGDNVYLEEDCDMSIYLEAIGYNRDDYLIINKYVHGDSEIRNYKQFKA